MKRYNRRLTHSIAFNESVVDIEKIYIEDFEHSDGEWVRYEDVKLMIETKPPEITIESESDIKAEIRKLRHEIISLKQVIRIAGTIEDITLKIECNCFHMSKLKEPLWYCPAHGYKKL